MNLKIGQEITVPMDYELRTGLTEHIVFVKKGDKGFVNSNGSVHYTTGEAKGKIQVFKDALEVKGYDTENIAKLVFARLDKMFNLREFLDDYEILENDFVGEIEDVLSDVLI